MHVISSHIRVDLDLRPIARNFPDEDNFISSELNCNAILICDENPALKQLFEFNKIDTETKMEPNKDDLLCWFVEYEAEPTYGKSFKINIHDTLNKTYNVLSSPAKKYCIEASGLPEHTVFIADPSTQRDYGIFARLSKNDHKYIIIAGIHRYGTWIIASFLHNILRYNFKDINNYNEKYSETFFSERDFIAVIWGDLDTEKLLVKRKRIYDGYMWANDANDWELVS
jgi:hypothetical protein